METDEKSNRNDWHNSRPPGSRALAGFVVVIVGVVLLARQAGADIPDWLTSWPMILIAVGLFIGAKRGFRGMGWLFPLIIGFAFLLNQIYPEFIDENFLWPIMVIFFGLLLMFRPRNWRGRRKWRKNRVDWEVSPEDHLNASTVFGSLDRNMVSKAFAGGDVMVIFGGSSLNLTQADFNGRVTIDITQIFGGMEIIVPPQWKVQSNLTTIFAGMEDSRNVHGEVHDDSKTLVLEGLVIFGGVEVKSYKS